MRIAAALIVLAPAVALAKPISVGVIARDEPQFATRAQAAKATATAAAGDLISVRVVAEHGDVIELSTAFTPDDCIAASDSGYALTVFVPRAALVPRLATPILKTFTDGTGYAIYAGAPARVHGSTVELVEPFLRATGVVVPASSLAMSVVQKPATKLPTVGEPLVCDPDLQPLDTWQKKIASKSDAKRKECEARLAAKAQQQPAKKTPAKKRSKDALPEELEAELVADLLTSSHDSCRPDPAESMSVYPPSCFFNAAAKLELDGKATIPVSAGGGGEVSRSGTHTLVTLAATCGQIRASADPKLLRGSGGTGGGIAGLGGSIRWTPRPFTKVYWPDGKLAGTYNGHADYGDADIEQRKDMICVAVRGVQSKVCHRRKDVDHR